jgi:hypothetical protein
MQDGKIERLSRHVTSVTLGSIIPTDKGENSGPDRIQGTWSMSHLVVQPKDQQSMPVVLC